MRGAPPRIVRFCTTDSGEVTLIAVTAIAAMTSFPHDAKAGGPPWCGTVYMVGGQTLVLAAHLDQWFALEAAFRHHVT